MGVPKSKAQKKIAYLLSMSSALTLIMSIVMFFICIFGGIPLHYMLFFLFLYSVFTILSFLFPEEKRYIDIQENSYTPMNYIGIYLSVNIIILGIILLFIRKYELSSHLFLILSITLLVVNSTILEFQTRVFSRIFTTKIGEWILRTFILITFVGWVVYGYNTITTSPAPVIDTTTPKKTQSETTGIISTVGEQRIVSPTESTQTSIVTSTKDTIGRKNETTGTINTDISLPGIQIDSIESVDGGAMARIENGKIVVEVIPTQDTGNNNSIIEAGMQSNPTPQTNPISAWFIESTATNNRGGGGLQGVVISAPHASPSGGKYNQYQKIQLSADGASGIFFTIDGSTPTCDGAGLTNIATTGETVTIKAISCFGGNRVRGPISTHTYTRE